MPTIPAVPFLKQYKFNFFAYYRPDLRALSLMRIGIAVIVLADLAIRAMDLRAQYTDEGFWPLSMVRKFGWAEGYWSLHTLNGNAGYIYALFSIHALFALMLLIGYQTRIATIALFLFTVSLHNRNVFILQSGDDLLRLTLFWGIFLPWNARYSLDVRQKVISDCASVPWFGFLLLQASVYFFSSCFKTGNDWHDEGSAIYYALSLEQLRIPITGDLV